MSIRLVLGAALAALFTLPALAAPIGIGSATQGSSTYNLALAISNVATNEGLDLRPQPYKATTQANGIVDAGELAFGLESAIALRQAYLGEGRYKDDPLTELRLVARLVPMRMVLAARKDSGIKTVADLKGKRLPAGFPAAVTGELLVNTMLGTQGLSYDDVQKVQVNDYAAMGDAFVDGQIDAFVHTIGTPHDEQVARDVGGLVILPTGSDAAAEAWVKQEIPAGSLYLLQPMSNVTTISEPTEILQYHFYVYTNVNEPAETVVKLIEAMRNGKTAMAEAVPSLSWFEPDGMYGDIGVPYHPAAEAYYRDHGLIH